MAITSFVLGRPGSGKTTAFRYICELMDRQGWSVRQIREYAILQQMFHNDLEHKRFRPIAHGGFDIIDFSVLDEALVQLEQQVKNYLQYAPPNELVMVEFARDNYQTALQPLSRDFLQKTHILYIDAQLETCIRRIHQRVKRNRREDNHYVSEKIIREYYGVDNYNYMQAQAQQNKLQRQREYLYPQIIHFIANDGPLADLYTGVDEFINALLTQHALCRPHPYPADEYNVPVSPDLQIPAPAQV